MKNGGQLTTLKKRSHKTVGKVNCETKILLGVAVFMVAPLSLKHSNKSSRKLWSKLFLRILKKHLWIQSEFVFINNNIILLFVVKN